jgi:CheY-like chemotaxis protein
MELSMARSLILEIEDDPNDVYFLQYAFREAGITNAVQVVGSGEEGIDYLSGTGAFADRRKYPLPCLILLDLKLPRKSGLEVLEWIRAQPGLKSMVIIVFTSSQQPEDVQRAYELGVNSFVVKPMDLQRRLQFAQLLKAWWLDFNQFAPMFEISWALPPAAGGGHAPLAA